MRLDRLRAKGSPLLRLRRSDGCIAETVAGRSMVKGMGVGGGRMRWVALASLGGFLSLSMPAWAQKVVQEPDRTVYRKKTAIDFSDVAVEGELTKPEGSYVLNRKKTTFRNLIRIRDNFIPELQKSVDNL
jgi:hypothetical protein